MNNIIDGNDSTEGIVSIDYYPIKTGENIVIFKEINGEVQREFRRLPFTILSSEPIGKFNWVELDGNQKYKWQLDIYDLEEFYKIRNLSENFWSVHNYQENIMLRHGLTYFKGIKKLQDLRNLSVDIETTGLEFLADDAKVVIISNTYDIKGVRGKKLFAIDEFESEEAMLIAWANWIREINPSNILNHNIFRFDLPYLIIRAKRLGIMLELGRDRSEATVEQWESKFRKDQNTFFNYRKIRIFGRNVIDTWFCAIDYDRVSQKYPNYKLKELAKFEKLAIEGREYYDAKLIGQNYTNPIEMAKIKAYADEDSREALDLFYIFCQTKFLINKHVPKSFTDLCLSATGSMCNSLMVRAYLQIGHSIAESSDKEKYEGAVTFGNTGIYENCFKIDVSSLYPSIMLTYKIEHPTKDENHYFLEMVQHFTNERLRNKALAQQTGDKWYNVLEQVQKVFINSFYGFLGATGLNYNYMAGAEAVTRYGREIILKTVQWATDKGFKIANCDTDSILFYKPDGTNFSNDEQQLLLNEINNLMDDGIVFANDGYFDKVIIFKAKNYILRNKVETKQKGSSIKAPCLELRLKAFIDSTIELILSEKKDYKELILLNYNKIAHEIIQPTIDINQWSFRKALTEKSLDSNTLNTIAKKIQWALEEDMNEIYELGDRVFLYFNNEEKLVLSKHYNNDHNQLRLLKKLFMTSQRFKDLLGKEFFPKYYLKTTYANLLAQSKARETQSGENIVDSF